MRYAIVRARSGHRLDRASFAGPSRFATSTDLFERLRTPRGHAEQRARTAGLAQHLPRSVVATNPRGLVSDDAQCGAAR